MKIITFIKNKLVSQDLSSYLYTAIARVTFVAQNLILIKIAAQNFSLSGLGKYSLFLSTGLIFSSLFMSMHSSAMLRLYSVTSNKEGFFTSLIKHSLILLFGCSLFLTLIAYFFGENLFASIILGSYSSALGIQLLITNYYRCNSNFRDLMIFHLIQAAILIIIFTFFKIIPITLTPVLIILFLTISILFASLWPIFHKRFALIGAWKSKINPSNTSEIIKYGTPFLFISVATLVLSTNPQFIFSFLNMDEDLGIFAANFAIAEKMVTFFHSLLATVLITRVYNSFDTDGLNAGIDEIKFPILLLIIFGGILIPFSSIFSFKISEIFTSTEVANLGSWILPLGIFSSLLLVTVSWLAEIFFCIKKPMIIAKLYITGSILSILINFILISNFGIYGAIMGSVSTNLLLICLTVFLISKLRQVYH